MGSHHLVPRIFAVENGKNQTAYATEFSDL